MKILQKIDETGFPFNWINWDNLRQSKSNRIEIYLRDEDYNTGLVQLFDTLFGQLRNDIRIFYNSWGDFASEDGEYFKEYPEEISKLKKGYSQILLDADISENYNGSCKCLDWDEFLTVELEYVLNWRALYGHYFYNMDQQFFFYFHYSGSIGLYYKESNIRIREILMKAGAKYRLEY